MEGPYTLTPRLQFHLLRHFTGPGADYLDRLAAAYGCSHEEAARQLQLPGSKFHPGFARDPGELWNVISGLIAAGDFQVRMEQNRKIFSFFFDPDKNPGGIGTHGLLPLTGLTPAERLRVVQQERDGFSVKVISSLESRTTHEMHMVILLTDDPFITTIYPGIYAPPFPDPRHQDPEELRKNQDFWDQHVLIA